MKKWNVASTPKYTPTAPARGRCRTAELEQRAVVLEVHEVRTTMKNLIAIMISSAGTQERAEVDVGGGDLDRREHGEEQGDR